MPPAHYDTSKRLGGIAATIATEIITSAQPAGKEPDCRSDHLDLPPPGLPPPSGLTLQVCEDEYFSWSEDVERVEEDQEDTLGTLSAFNISADSGLD
jgi:hypothetical protein